MAIPPVSSKTIISVPAGQQVKYLYNHVSDIVKEAQVPATFKVKEIDIAPASQKQALNVVQRLVELGAKFVTKHS